MLLFFVFLAFVLCGYIHKKDIWCAVVDGSVLFLLVLYVITEMLSIIYKLTTFNVSLCWIICGVCGICYVLKNGKSIDYIEELKEASYKLIKSKYAIVLGIITIVMLGLSAVTITSNWDSMSYHMPRIMHWIQNESVAYYATSMPRQIYNPPLSEYVIRRLQNATNRINTAFFVL